MIPKIIHSISPRDKNKWHPIWENCLKSWYRHYPQEDYEHIMWDDEKIDYFVKEKFEKYYSVYSDFPFHIMKIDMFRLCLMYEYGGLYKDMDCYCYENFYDDIVKDIALIPCIIRFPLNVGLPEYFQNFLFVSEPKKQFWLHIIEHLIERYNSTKIIRNWYDESCHEYILNVSGPFLFNHIIKVNPLLFNEVQELPHEKYNPLITSYSNKEEMKNVKCMHFLSGIWGSDHFAEIIQNANMHNVPVNEFIIEHYKSIQNIDITNFDG